MNLRVDPGSPEWTHLMQRLHWTEVCPTSREQGYMGFVGQMSNRGRAGIRVDIGASKQEENKETSEGW